MAALFFDSSAIVKRYLSEPGSAWVVGLTGPTSGNRVYIAAVTGVEVVSAITRKSRGGGLSQAAARVAIDRFRHDLAVEYQYIELSSQLRDRAMSLAETHALRGYDAVQLAAAPQLADERAASGLPPVTLISADAELNTAATAEGLSAAKPNDHP